MPPFDGFIENVLAEIKTIIERKEIGSYWDIHKKHKIWDK